MDFFLIVMQYSIYLQYEILLFLRMKSVGDFHLIRNYFRNSTLLARLCTCRYKGIIYYTCHRLHIFLCIFLALGGRRATAEALELAIKEFSRSLKNRKLLWAFTDGKSNTGSPLKAAYKLKRSGKVLIKISRTYPNYILSKLISVNGINKPSCRHELKILLSIAYNVNVPIFYIVAAILAAILLFRTV